MDWSGAVVPDASTPQTLAGDAAEPAAWILGGDLNLTENSIHNRMQKYQPYNGEEPKVQIVDAGSLIKRHGDLAMAQHLTAFQSSSLIGRDYGGVSDNHNMVVVLAKMKGEEQPGGASEPTGSTPCEPPAGLAEPP